MSQFNKYLEIIQESYLKINDKEVSNLNKSFWEEQMTKTGKGISKIKVEKEGQSVKHINISKEDWENLEKEKFNLIPNVLQNSYVEEIDPKDPKKVIKHKVKSLSEINRMI
jgi:hypothetical protein